MLHSPLCLTIVVLLLFKMSVKSNEYQRRRAQILNEERQTFTGGRVVLSDKEKCASEVILREKSAELKIAHDKVADFPAVQHFFQAKAAIDKSKVFSLLRKLPKGASLHTHMGAAVSVEYILENITRRDNIYGCVINNVFKLRFMANPDQDRANNWKSLKRYREENRDFDVWLRQQLSLVVDNPESTYPTPGAIWQRFKKIFTTEYDMLSYLPVFKDYILQLLSELYDDNVFYAELRGTFMPLYDLDGTIYDNKKFLEVFIEVVEEFKKRHPKFIGVQYIHSVYRGVAPAILKDNLDELVQLKRIYPDFIAGFDFVGYEEEGNTYLFYNDILQEASKELKFFFHAGETNSFGHTDLNLVDAILLNTSRIGHGFALPKHPKLMDLVEQQQIAIELCPISNQVLKLIVDPRNHPAIYMLARGLPVVVCNDDPSFWGATGLSYDWYVAFMTMTPENSGIEVLKKFAMDSIKFSSMKESDKTLASKGWRVDWDNFVEDILNNKM